MRCGAVWRPGRLHGVAVCQQTLRSGFDINYPELAGIGVSHVGRVAACFAIDDLLAVRRPRRMKTSGRNRPQIFAGSLHHINPGRLAVLSERLCARRQAKRPVEYRPQRNPSLTTSDFSHRLAAETDRSFHWPCSRRQNSSRPARGWGRILFPD